MDDRIKYPWQQAVVDAFLAAPEDLPAKISIAERGISAHLRESDDLELEERIALKDALRTLGVLISESSLASRSPENPEATRGLIERQPDVARATRRADRRFHQFESKK
jgi:hypothetical protein